MRRLRACGDLHVVDYDLGEKANLVLSRPRVHLTSSHQRVSGKPLGSPDLSYRERHHAYETRNPALDINEVSTAAPDTRGIHKPAY